MVTVHMRIIKKIMRFIKAIYARQTKEIIIDESKKCSASLETTLIILYENIRLYLVFVVVCILSSYTVVVSSLFLEILIDDYITPLLLENTPSFTPLLHTIILMGCIYIIGVLATYLYNRFMVKISQGTLKEIRDDMFSHMQELPIRYFDTHTIWIIY